MAEAVNDIQEFGQNNATGDASDNHATQRVACDRWYIFRYKTMSNYIRDFLLKHPDNVFFPYRLNRKVRELPVQTTDGNDGSKKDTEEMTMKVEYRERPCIPGYIFIHGHVDDAIALGSDVGLYPWVKRFSNYDRRRMIQRSLSCRTPKAFCYHSIAHRAMLRLMDVVSHVQSEIRIYDPSEIDPEENDLVEFISGTLAGQRGYIQTKTGKEGGMVIVPLDDADEDTNSPDETETKGPRRSVLHYGIPAFPDQYRIIRFANPTRNRECIKRAQIHAKDILRAYVEGEDIDDAQQKRLRGYAIRYADAEMSTDIQRANLTLLLYRIYTILDDAAKCEVIRASIQNTVTPAFDQHIAAESGKRKSKVIDKKAKFLKECDEIANAAQQRQTRLSAQHPQDTSGC